jgi:hypothetical protein
MTELLGVAVELTLREPICGLHEFRRAIQGLFRIARLEIPGCLYAPIHGCVDASDPTILFHVTVFADLTSYRAFMAGPHSEFAQAYRQHVLRHSYLTFQVTGDLAKAVEDGVVGDVETEALNSLGHAALNGFSS